MSDARELRREAEGSHKKKEYQYSRKRERNRIPLPNSTENLPPEGKNKPLSSARKVYRGEKLRELCSFVSKSVVSETLDSKGVEWL